MKDYGPPKNRKRPSTLLLGARKHLLHEAGKERPFKFYAKV